MKKADVILLIVILVLGMAGIGFYYGTNRNASYVLVQVDGELVGTYDLREDTVVTICSGQDGENILEIRDGKAEITSANCPNGDCVVHKEISKSNESIVCLPHKMAVWVVTELKEEAPDTYAY
ncbi:MAG: NusG domain II-containing protein [Lachnospiraceae bacterium]|nr:NusG domain II-containing protein [Lachnospiraceae bacterium]